MTPAQAAEGMAEALRTLLGRLDSPLGLGIHPAKQAARAALAAYEASAEQGTAPTEAVARAAATDATLHACLMNHRAGNLSYVEALEMAAVEQAKRADRLVADLTRKAAMECEPMVVMLPPSSIPAAQVVEAARVAKHPCRECALGACQGSRPDAPYLECDGDAGDGERCPCKCNSGGRP